ncbi:MAG: high frequency lysogenization protein HflD [Ectothiorhodospiraceae bacterium]|nr:high frequency lysogenization protein HflD [Ectothiorhodospiraceae bacterium]
MNRTDAQTLAMAAIFQALAEVRQLAREGRADSGSVAHCLAGLLNPYHGDVAEAYGGGPVLVPGLRQLHQQLTQPGDMEITRYAVVVLHLERKLVRDKQRLALLSRGREQARGQAAYFHPAHESVVGRLADLYSETVSTLKPRIMVQGNREWLEDDRNANLIRALLLAAIRAATLWRDQGGSRFKLLFRRKQLLHTTHLLIESHDQRERNSS